MSEIGAITQAAQQATTQAAQPTSLETQLFQYAAQLQAQGVVTGDRAMLANPSHIGGELFRYLRGFVERSGNAEAILQNMAKEARAVGGAQPEANSYGMRFASLGDESPPLHGGPARAPLDQVTSLEPDKPREKTAAEGPGSSMDEIKHLVEQMAVVLHFHTEATILGHGTRKVVDDVNMLIRSQ